MLQVKMFYRGRVLMVISCKLKLLFLLFFFWLLSLCGFFMRMVGISVNSKISLVFRQIRVLLFRVVFIVQVNMLKVLDMVCIQVQLWVCSFFFGVRLEMMVWVGLKLILIDRFISKVIVRVMLMILVKFNVLEMRLILGRVISERVVRILLMRMKGWCWFFQNYILLEIMLMIGWLRMFVIGLVVQIRLIFLMLRLYLDCSIVFSVVIWIDRVKFIVVVGSVMSVKKDLFSCFCILSMVVFFFYCVF